MKKYLDNEYDHVRRAHLKAEIGELEDKLYDRYKHRKHYKEESSSGESETESESEVDSDKGDPKDADVIADVDYKGGKKHRKKSVKKHRRYKDFYYDDEDHYWDLYERRYRGDPYYFYDDWEGHYPYSYGSASHHHALWKADKALNHHTDSTYRYRDDYGYDHWGYPYSGYYHDAALNAKIDHAVKKELGESLGEIDKKAESTVKKLDKALKN